MKRSKKLRKALHAEYKLVNQGVSDKVSKRKLEKIKQRLINIDRVIKANK